MKQIIVVLENKIGLLAKITEALALKKINIESISAMEHNGLAVFTLEVPPKQYDKALQALRDASFPAVSEDALVIKIKNAPGSLAQISKSLADAGINMRSIKILTKQKDFGLVAIAVDNLEKGMQVLKKFLLSS